MERVFFSTFLFSSHFHPMRKKSEKEERGWTKIALSEGSKRVKKRRSGGKFSAHGDPVEGPPEGMLCLTPILDHSA